jgi:hypothetical protein
MDNNTPPPTPLPATRLPDWQPRLAALFAQRLAAPFEWGVHDCCLFAADAVLAVTGHDPAADLRGAYTCEDTAAPVLAANGGLAALARARAGPAVPVALAQAGDIGLCLQAEPRALALAVFGGNVWHAPGPQGLVAHPAASISTAWRCTAA